MIIINDYKYEILSVEITRKCNLKCVHCLRGDAQNISITPLILDKLFDNVKDCKIITIMGGETLLELDMLDYFVSKIISSKWNLKSLQLTTNGTVLDDRVILILSRLAENTKAHILLRISKDQFHNIKNSEIAYNYYSSHNKHKNISVECSSRPIKNLRYVGRAVNYVNSLSVDDIKSMGFTITVPFTKTMHRIRIEDNTVICPIQISVNGNVSLDEEISYDDLDRLSLGNIINSSMAEMINNHNNNCLLCCSEWVMQQANESSLKRYNDLGFNQYLTYLAMLCEKIMFETIYSIRTSAHKLYTFVPAEEIIRNIPMPCDFKEYEAEIHNIYLAFKKYYTDNQIDDYIFKHLNSDLLTIYKLYKNIKNASEIPCALTAICNPKSIPQGVHNYLIKSQSDTDYYRFIFETKTKVFKHLENKNNDYKSGRAIPFNKSILPCHIGERVK